MGYWVQVHQSPIAYRYIDWSITVPLQMIEFNLILKAAGKSTTAAGFFKLLLGTIMMLAFDTWARRVLSRHGLVSPWAWLAGASFCSRSSAVRPAVLQVTAPHMSPSLSTPCA